MNHNRFDNLLHNEIDVPDVGAVTRRGRALRRRRRLAATGAGTLAAVLIAGAATALTATDSETRQRVDPAASAPAELSSEVRADMCTTLGGYAWGGDSSPTSSRPEQIPTFLPQGWRLGGAARITPAATGTVGPTDGVVLLDLDEAGTTPVRSVVITRDSAGRPGGSANRLPVAGRVRGNTAFHAVGIDPSTTYLTWSEGGSGYNLTAQGVDTSAALAVAESTRLDADGRIVDLTRTGWDLVEVQATTGPTDVALIDVPSRTSTPVATLTWQDDPSITPQAGGAADDATGSVYEWATAGRRWRLVSEQGATVSLPDLAGELDTSAPQVTVKNGSGLRIAARGTNSLTLAARPNPIIMTVGAPRLALEINGERALQARVGRTPAGWTLVSEPATEVDGSTPSLHAIKDGRMITFEGVIEPLDPASVDAILSGLAPASETRLAEIAQPATCPAN